MAAIDLRTGARVWEKELGSNNQPWIAGQYMYVLSDNNELLALNKNDGKIIWNTTIPNVNDKPGEFAVGPVLANNRLLVPTSDGHGRVAAFEVLHAIHAARNLIRESKTYQLPNIMQTNRKMGMMTMDDAIVQLYFDGVITRDMAIQYAQAPENMYEKLSLIHI